MVKKMYLNLQKSITHNEPVKLIVLITGMVKYADALCDEKCKRLILKYI